MKQALKYVNFYKHALLRGILEGFNYDDNLSLYLEPSVMEASYITPMFDTNEMGCTYNRLSIDSKFSGVKLEVIVAATDQRVFYIDDEATDIADYLARKDVLYTEKRAVLMALPHVRQVNDSDILLHSLEGRYAWVFISISAEEERDCHINGIRLEFPRYSFTDYFPEIYQGDEFFDRYIGIFQSMYLDAERKIDKIPSLLDYENADDEQVAYLASWLGVKNEGNLFSTEQLRYIIKNIDLFQGAKGTPKALEAIIKLATGITPRIVEHFQWSKLPLSPSQKQLNSELYGYSSNHFAIIIDLTKSADPLPISEEGLKRLIESYCAIGTGYKLVYLRRSSHTDTHCYLDVNSYLSRPEIAVVDGVKLGSYITVG